MTAGVRVPASPHAADGRGRGRSLFQGLGCSRCHAGPAWTTSLLPGPAGSLAPDGQIEVEAVLVDVGTYAPDGGGLGADGFDVPTLLGLAATAPYLHDGSAATLSDVLGNPSHAGPRLGGDDELALIAFLLGIDGSTEPVVQAGPAGGGALSETAAGAISSPAGRRHGQCGRGRCGRGRCGCGRWRRGPPSRAFVPRGDN